MKMDVTHFYNELYQTILETLQDETRRVIAIGLSIIVISLFMIYKNSKPTRHKQRLQTPQISIDKLVEAEKKIISDITGAVGNMKEKRWRRDLFDL